METGFLVAVSLLALLPLISGTCDHLSLHFYKELGCRPVHTTDPACPSRFDCDQLEVNRHNYCVAKDLVVNDGGAIEFGSGISNPCVPNCYCQKNVDQTFARFRWECTHNDCPHFFGRPPPKDCYWKEELKTCCPSKTSCKPNLAKCVYNGRTYKENDKFYTFKESSCMKCICQPSFNGTLTEPWCTELGCDLELHVGNQLAMGCAPVYGKSFCCPIDWRCPDSEDTVMTTSASRPAVAGEPQCKFGNLLLNIGDIVLPDLEASCQCHIPPYVVCTST